MSISVTVRGLAHVKKKKKIVGNEITHPFLNQCNTTPTSNKKLNLSHSQLISLGSVRNDISVTCGNKTERSARWSSE